MELVSTFRSPPSLIGKVGKSVFTQGKDIVGKLNSVPSTIFRLCLLNFTAQTVVLSYANLKVIVKFLFLDILENLFMHSCLVGLITAMLLEISRLQSIQNSAVMLLTKTHSSFGRAKLASSIP